MISVETTRTMSPSEAGGVLAHQKRSCGRCGEGTIRCTEVVEERRNGFDQGRIYRYACDACESPLEEYEGGWMKLKVLGLQTILFAVIGLLTVPTTLFRFDSSPASLVLGLFGAVALVAGLFSAFKQYRFHDLRSRSPILYGG